MTMIIKRYWIWDEKFNSTDFKLGKNIDEYLLEGKLIRSEDNPLNFTTEKKNPWSVIVNKKNEIESVFFREKFFSLVMSDIWDLEITDFTNKIDKYFEAKDKDDESTDTFHVTFRGGFVAIAGIKRAGLPGSLY